MRIACIACVVMHTAEGGKKSRAVLRDTVILASRVVFQQGRNLHKIIQIIKIPVTVYSGEV